MCPRSHSSNILWLGAKHTPWFQFKKSWEYIFSIAFDTESQKSVHFRWQVPFYFISQRLSLTILAPLRHDRGDVPPIIYSLANRAVTDHSSNPTVINCSVRTHIRTHMHTPHTHKNKKKQNTTIHTKLSMLCCENRQHIIIQEEVWPAGSQRKTS